MMQRYFFPSVNTSLKLTPFPAMGVTGCHANFIDFVHGNAVVSTPFNNTPLVRVFSKWTHQLGTSLLWG